MPLNTSPGNTAPLDDILEEHKKSPDLGLGGTLREIGQESLLGNTMGLAYRHLVAPPLATRAIPNPYGRGFRTEFKTPEEVAAQGDVLFENELQYKKSDAFDPDVKWEKGMTRNRAKVLGDWASTTRAREIYRKAHPYASFLIALGAGVADPVNFIPLFGPVAKFSLLGRAGIRSLEGAGANLIADMLTYHDRTRLNVNEMSQDMIMQDIGIGALLGPILGGAFDAGHFLWGRSVKKAGHTVPPPAPEPVLPEVAPVIPPAMPPVVETTPSDRIGAGEFEAGYDLSKLKGDLETEQNVIISRAILNDGIYQYLNGDPIILSPMSKAIIEQKAADITLELEKNRADFKSRNEPDVTEARTRADKEIETLGKKESKLRGQVERAEKAKKPNQARIADLTSQLNDTRDQLDNARAARGRVESKRQGYVIDPNPILQDFQYPTMKDHKDLPVEIATELPTEVQTRIDQIIRNAQKSGRTEEMGPNIKFEMAPHLGKQYAGTYGRMLHSTSDTFAEYDLSKGGTNTKAKSAPEGIWLARNPSTVNADMYTRADTQEAEAGTKAPQTRVENVTFKNPYVYDYQGKNPLPSEEPGAEKRSYTNHILAAKKAGNDGVIFLNNRDGSHIPDTIMVAFKPEQVTPALQAPQEIKWTEPKVDVNWKTPESPIDEVAVEISKPMKAETKFEKEAELDNIDVNKPTGVADAEVDRIEVETAKMGMTDSEKVELDERLKAIKEDMASDDRTTKASEAVIKCRNR